MRSQLISQSARLRHNLTESVKFENIFEKKIQNGSKLHIHLECFRTQFKYIFVSIKTIIRLI